MGVHITFSFYLCGIILVVFAVQVCVSLVKDSSINPLIFK